MLSKAIVAPCICLATAACSGGGSTPSGGVTLKGQLLSSASAQQSDPLLLAMGWYPTFAGTAPGSPVGAVITQANIELHGSFPVDFNFTLTGTPPAAAFFDLSKTGGTGHLAYGVPAMTSPFGVPAEFASKRPFLLTSRNAIHPGPEPLRLSGGVPGYRLVQARLRNRSVRRDVAGTGRRLQHAHRHADPDVRQRRGRQRGERVHLFRWRAVHLRQCRGSLLLHHDSTTGDAFAVARGPRPRL